MILIECSNSIKIIIEINLQKHLFLQISTHEKEGKLLIIDIKADQHYPNDLTCIHNITIIKQSSFSD